jgi:hypothetical protein
MVGGVCEGKYADVNYHAAWAILSSGQASFLPLILCFWLVGFGLLSHAAVRQSLLLRSIVRTGFQFVGLTLETVEVKDCLGVLAHGSRYSEDSKIRKHLESTKAAICPNHVWWPLQDMLIGDADIFPARPVKLARKVNSPWIQVVNEQSGFIPLVDYAKRVRVGTFNRENVVLVDPELSIIDLRDNLTIGIENQSINGQTVALSGEAQHWLTLETYQRDSEIGHYGWPPSLY